MPVDTIVKDPDSIREVAEVDDILARLSAYEQERGCEAGVVLIQRRQFGGLHEIVSKEEADQWLSRRVFDDGRGNRTCEWGIKFYPHSYFEELRARLNNGGERNYS